LRFSSEKALKRSREARLTAKARGDGFSCMTKKLAFSGRLFNERCTANLHDCSTETAGPKFLEPIEEIEEDKNEISLGDVILAIEYPERMSNI
jgi:hypothetical protein